MSYACFSRQERLVSYLEEGFWALTLVGRLTLDFDVSQVCFPKQERLVSYLEEGYWALTLAVFVFQV